MRLEELQKWAMPSRLIQQWRQRQGEMLLPVQIKAVRRGLMGSNGGSSEYNPPRLLISAPTSSGKSFCAELAAVKALVARRKTVMLFPLKSLAEQKYRLFEQTYSELGVKCLIVTGDHPENDRRFLDGNYQIAMVIYEKFDLLLTRSLDALKNIGLVVVDEIQTIGDPGRGAVLERLLTKIKASQYRPGLVGLSAVIGDDVSSAGQLAEWLDANLVEERIRPVDLMRGVATEGSFRYRLFNNGLDGTEEFVKPDGDENTFDSFIRQIKDSSGSTLVFLKSRLDTVEAAFTLAASVSWPPAKKALLELEGEEPSFLIRSLKQALGRGVAFHNSDLSATQRQIVEQAFAEKEVKALFSTTTLAMGVNLPADIVYLETVKYSSGKYDLKPSLVPVSRAEFDNMSGRAGRLGLTTQTNNPGRAVVMAENQFDADILWQTYIADQSPETVKSALDSMPPEDLLLDMVVSGLISTGDETTFAETFRHTFYYYCHRNPLPFQVDEVLASLLSERLITTDDLTNEINATPLGVTVARGGLSVKQALHYQRKLQQGYPETSAGWIAVALGGSGWDLPPGALSRTEQLQNIPVRMLHRHFDYLLDEAVILLGHGNLNQRLTYVQAAALKGFLLLERWRQLTPVQVLEEEFQMHLGQIMSLGETAAYLVTGIADLIETFDRSSTVPDRLRQCAFSLKRGMPFDIKPMCDLFGRVLNRHDFAALVKAGIRTVPELCQADENTIATLINGSCKLKLFNAKLNKLKQELQMQTKCAVAENSHKGIMTPAVSGLESIEIDGASDRERYLVRINGFPVRLTGKSFKYFTKLAWSRLNRDSGWIYKEDIEVGFNQARYLYRMKGEISAGLNMSWPVIENNRLGYYRLKADPSKIRINVDNLKNHPDYEVRSLVLNQIPGTVN
ncbi:MAG: DEAD/DEAH box helicase [Candidatus Zixiibacteriota bacterium]|nr:MAG: DEAD/DEAH box helicase [candidate division Zixibacteria bacterium]